MSLWIPTTTKSLMAVNYSYLRKAKSTLLVGTAEPSPGSINGLSLESMLDPSSDSVPRANEN